MPNVFRCIIAPITAVVIPLRNNKINIVCWTVGIDFPKVLYSNYSTVLKLEPMIAVLT